MNRGVPTTSEMAHGVRNGPIWWPAEVDVSIRAGWFWHEDETDSVMSVRRLVELSFDSVGRGTNLILNLPPDTRGRIPDLDAGRVRQWNEIWQKADASDIARDAEITATSTYGSSRSFQPASVTDRREDRYWCAAETSASLTVRLKHPGRFDVVRLEEYLPLGQRVNGFSVEIDPDGTGAWHQVANAEAIGSQRLLRLERPVEAVAIRIVFTEASAPPAIKTLGLLLLPPIPEQPIISRNADGLVTLKADAPRIAYTLDGSEPSSTSAIYTGPFPLPTAGTVTAAIVEGHHLGPVAQRHFGASKAHWTIASASAPEAHAVIDEDLHTIWKAPFSAAHNPEITVNFGKPLSFSILTLSPAKILAAGVAAPARFSLYVRADGQDWEKIVSDGEFSNIGASSATQRIKLGRRVTAVEARLVITSTVGQAPTVGFAELGFE